MQPCYTGEEIQLERKQRKKTYRASSATDCLYILALAISKRCYVHTALHKTTAYYQ